MEVQKSAETVKPEAQGETGKKTYQEPKLVEHGQWTEKTLPPIGGSGG